MSTADPQTILSNAAAQIESVVLGLIQFYTGDANTFVNNGKVDFPSVANLIAQAQAAIGNASVRHVTWPAGTANPADTMEVSDNGNTVLLDSASAIVEMIPNNTTVPGLKPGFTADFIQLAAGQVSFAVQAGDTLLSVGAKVKISAQNGAATVRLLAVDPNTGARTWLLAGSLV